MYSNKLFSSVLDADQLERFKDHWKRKGKTEEEIEPLLREYEGRVLADEPPTPEQREKWEKEAVIYMREVLGATEEEIERCGKEWKSEKYYEKPPQKPTAKGLAFCKAMLGYVRTLRREDSNDREDTGA